MNVIVNFFTKYQLKLKLENLIKPVYIKIPITSVNKTKKNTIKQFS